MLKLWVTQILQRYHKFIDSLCIPFWRNTVFEYMGIQSEFCLSESSDPLWIFKLNFEALTHVSTEIFWHFYN